MDILYEKYKLWGDLDTGSYIPKKRFRNAKHADLVILMEHPETNHRIIKKRYTPEHVNVFFNEVVHLDKLQECTFIPKLLKVRSDKLTLYMSYCGSPIKAEKLHLPVYQDKIRKYSDELRTKWDIYHNDLKPGNICLLDGQLYFIDFGWASNKKLKPGYSLGRSGYKNQKLFIQ